MRLVEIDDFLARFRRVRLRSRRVDLHFDFFPKLLGGECDSAPSISISFTIERVCTTTITLTPSLGRFAKDPDVLHLVGLVKRLDILLDHIDPNTAGRLSSASATESSRGSRSRDRRTGPRLTG